MPPSTEYDPIILGLTLFVVAIVIWISDVNREKRQQQQQQQQGQHPHSPSKAVIIVRRPASKTTSSSDIPYGRVTASILQQVKRLPPFVVKKTSSLVRILEIFPNADLELIKGLLLSRQFNVEKVVDDIVIHMNDHNQTNNHWRWMESRYHDYMPLQRQHQQQSGSSGPKRPRGGQEEEEEAESLRNTMESMWATFNFMSVDAFQPSFHYKTLAAHQIRSDFPFLNHIGATRVLKLSNNHYALAHDKLLRAVKGAARVEEEQVHDAINDDTNEGELSLTEIHQYRRVIQALTQGHALDEDQLARVIATMTVAGNQELEITVRRTCFRQERNYTPAPPTTPNDLRLEETAYVQHKLTSWTTSFENKLDRKLCQLSEEPHVECGCCYDEYPTSEMVTCADGHLFCTACLVSFVENQIFACGNLGIDPETKRNLLQLRCFQPKENCQSVFPRAALESSLMTATLRQHDEIQSSLNLAVAELKDLCSCPKCGYQAIVSGSSNSSEDKDKDRSTRLVVFDCPVEDCRYKSCVKCGEKAHYKMTCQEAAEDHKPKEGRLQVEEAITKAKIRRCPKCNKPIIKSDGCNKVRCSCGNSICYICRKSIDSHCHFFGGSCKLFTNDQDAYDNEAMRTAGTKAAEEFVKNNKSLPPDIKKKIAEETEVLLQNDAASKNSWAWPW